MSSVWHRLAQLSIHLRLGGNSLALYQERYRSILGVHRFHLQVLSCKIGPQHQLLLGSETHLSYMVIDFGQQFRRNIR